VNRKPLELDDGTIIDFGRDTLTQVAGELDGLAGRLDAAFAAAVRAMLDCRGLVLVTGLGKSGIVARKLAATLTSTGTPANFLHPVESAHGDLGIVRRGDAMIAISRSGNNPEVTQLVGRAHHFGLTLIALTGNADSDLARNSDIVIDCSVSREACPLNLTPSTSAAAAMVVGDALALALLRMRGFTRENFAVYHPSGVLGRSLLLQVSELMHAGDELPVVSHRLTLRESLPEIVGKRLGGACVVDDEGRLAGVCVDGDIKRSLLAREDALDRPITESMNPAPTTILPDSLAVTALRQMEEREEGPITLLIVADEQRRPLGLLHIHDILRAGIL